MLTSLMKEEGMSMQEAILRLSEILEGLGFYSAPLKHSRENAQRKFTWKPERHQWLTVVLWTTVTSAGPLPNHSIPIQILLFGNKLANRCVWMFSETKRFRHNKEVFAKRLRKRAELAVALSESVKYCPDHPGPVILKVTDGHLAWACIKLQCPFRGYVPETLSKAVKRHTPQGSWRSHCE